MTSNARLRLLRRWPDMAMIQMPLRCDEELRDAIEDVISTDKGRLSRDQYLRDRIAEIPEVAAALKRIRGESAQTDRTSSFRRATQ
jgi:hypothetical protein